MAPTPGPDREATDQRILEAIRNSYAPAVGTSEVADKLGVERQTVDKHLRKLDERELVETKLIGQVRVWWLSDDGRKWLAEQDC